MKQPRFCAVALRPVLLASLLSGVLAMGFGLPAETAQMPPAQPAETAPAQAPSSSHAPVPVPEPTEKALRYYRSGNLLWLLSLALSIAVPLLFLFSGLSAGMRNVATRIGRKWFFVIALYTIFFVLLNFLIDLPLSYYSGFVRQHSYGLSNQTFSKWMTDQLKGLMVSLIVNPLILWVPFLLLKKSPKRWWLYTGLALLPFIIFSTLIAPVLIDPLFNKFGPMKDKALETRILSLAGRAGIEGARVYEVDKSVDTKTVNAYVTGLGSTKRIVLWDTTMKKLTTGEILVVMGHEMGHYVLGHVRQLTVAICLFAIIGLYAVHKSAGSLIRRYRVQWGFDELGDVASLPLISLLFGLALFVLTPLINTVTRHNEHEADRFGLEITRDNLNAALAFVKLQQENLGVPRPGLLYKIFRESHPPLGERIDFANSYRPWETGQPLKYGHLFRGK